MPAISLRKALYDECIRQGVEPAEYANKVVEQSLEDEFDIEVTVDE